MAAGTSMTRGRLSVLLIPCFLYALTARAQERASSGRGDFGVPLQPFFLSGEPANDSSRGEVMRVAYYAPRAQPAPVPHAEAVEQADVDNTEPANEGLVLHSNRP